MQDLNKKTRSWASQTARDVLLVHKQTHAYIPLTIRRVRAAREKKIGTTRGVCFSCARASCCRAIGRGACLVKRQAQRHDEFLAKCLLQGVNDGADLSGRIVARPGIREVQVAHDRVEPATIRYHYTHKLAK